MPLKNVKIYIFVYKLSLDDYMPLKLFLFSLWLRKLSAVVDDESV